ncbi:16S rRNA (guanine(966)-N(2))-methyltransferase RsmD [Psychrobacter jeotgali]|uniref:16S rRNA (guanine(966)-N(2))-methyltransferase RsmD n=1 Tax=Psychrobacter jeotgali TaxID=179010 RepID=UPI001918E404|nr:16S rRNA (guanine(966)-N(2))-methyltransferase RsmD [Psychrobacter jeotgali]
MAKRSPARQRKPKAAAKNKNSAVGNVRIIGGQFKRRVVSFIDAEGLRPTPDRLRETLFNWLLNDLHGARVLDSCAGSGVLGFEALSRGAAHCTFIEANQAQSQMLRKSAEQLSLDSASYQVLYGPAEQVLDQLNPFNQSSEHEISSVNNSTGNPTFDIVFIDPPYAADLWQPILTALLRAELIDNTTLIYIEADKDLTEHLQQWVVSMETVLTVQKPNGFECIKQTKVGQVVAGLYQLSP